MAGELDEAPINVVNANLDAAHATLDILLELTWSRDAAERLESLGAKSLSTAIHNVMRQIEKAQEAAEKFWNAAWSAARRQAMQRGEPEPPEPQATHSGKLN